MKKQIIIFSALAAIVVAALLFVIFRQKHDMAEMVEQMAWEKEELENEYEDLAIQFDGYQGLDIRNDSLQDLLSKEQQRVQDLLEELRITKVTNARRIAELKKELATVRTVMAGYVAQIDSLNRTNQRLTVENREYRAQAQQATATARQLQQEKTALSEVVNRASMLEVVDFSVLTLNKSDRKTKIFSAIRKLQISYTIAKNVTAQPGVKQVYIRLVRPDGELLQRDSTCVFQYEGEEVGYSMVRDIEFSGDAYTDTQYWSQEDRYAEGIYNADFFIEGNLVGSFPFRVKQ